MKSRRKPSIDARVGKHVNVSARALQPVGALPSAERMRESVARSTSSSAKYRMERRVRSQFSTDSRLGSGKP